MAEKHIANAEAGWRAICVTPDLCKVGKKIIPFDSFRDLSHDMVASPDVNARGTPVYRITDWVQGTDGNAGRGIVSGTSGAPGHVQMLADDTTVRVNGLICARHETVVLMNYGAAPNTVGRLQTDQGAPLGVAENGRLPCNDPPKTSQTLERLQAIKDKLAFMDPDQLDEWVRFADTHAILDDWISAIDVETEGNYGWFVGSARWTGDKAAQGMRAVLGFFKDAGLGLGQLAYGAGKMLNPVGAFHAGLDAHILTEHIRLGNICLESLKQAAAAAGKELAKPVTDAWERGDYVEAVTRAGLEIGTLVVAVGQVAKAATAARAARAGAVAAEVADDMGRAAGAATGAADDVARGGAKAADAPKGGNGVKIKEMTNHQKAAFGERSAHDAMTRKGYEPTGKTDGNYKPGETGIDGVYKNPNPPPDYIITESKYGNSQLSTLEDGTRQMSDKWIEPRLADKVGRAEADAIQQAMREGRVERWLIRTGENGSVTATRIDQSGYVVRGDAGKVSEF